jgi:hypothetical protein
MLRTPDEIEELAQVWCRWHDLGQDENQWAEQDFISDVIEQDQTVEECFEIVLRLLAVAPNSRVLGIIGTSPVEDLLAREPSRVASLIVTESPAKRTASDGAESHVAVASVPESTFAEVVAFAQPIKDFNA